MMSDLAVARPAGDRAGRDIAGPVLRLRPIVHASPVPDGLHVRGARSSFTMNGGSGLWPLWQALSVRLAEGWPAERLRDLPRQPAVRVALAALLRQLREHDMLVEVPPAWGETGRSGEPPHRIARWLEAVAPDPVMAWERIRCAEVTVRGAGPVAAAAGRALASAAVGVLPAPRRQVGGGEGTGEGDRGQRVVLEAGAVSVAAQAGAEVGFVTPLGAARPVCRAAVAIAERIGLSAPAAAPPHVLAALVGGAAAHRLVCALADLPDPGADRLAAAAGTAPAGYPTVLIARLDPLRADYRPWLAADLPAAPRARPGPADPAVRPGPADPAVRPGLVEALSKVDVLTDPETGVLPGVELDDLPQVPVGLARCRTGDTVICGVGTDARTARLTAALGAAEHALGLAGCAGVVVGADRTHAGGVLLRRLIHHRRPTLGGTDVPASEWAGAAPARSWWKALTLRFGIDAELRVRGLAPGVFHAEVYSAEVHSAEVRSQSQPLSWAVESTPADAAAFCALAAAGTVAWRVVDGAGAGGGPTGGILPSLVHVPCGATPTAADASPGDRPWQTGPWVWPAQLSEHEPAFQQRMRQVLGDHVPPAPVPPGSALTRALAAVGVVVLAATP